jgi:Spy/CpxP family protein refolding chaperone
MLRPLTTTVGSTLAALCLVSTLAMAQSPSSTPSQYPAQPMTPQYGNTMPQQGHRQQPTQSEMRYPSERQAMRMICSKDNGKGNCVAARGADGREIVVVGEGLKSGASMTCVDRGNMVDCDPAS